MKEILDKLAGGDRRSIGRSDEVVAEVLAVLSLFQDERLRPEVMALLQDLTETGSPAMSSRGRKLFARLRESV